VGESGLRTGALIYAIDEENQLCRAE